MQDDNWPYWLTGSRRSSVAWSVASHIFAAAGPSLEEPVAGIMSLDRQTGAPPPTKPDVWVETLDPHAADAFVADWRDLAGRALEANVFSESACLLTAALHLSRGRKPIFVFVWETGLARTRGRLLAVCPLRQPTMMRPLQVWTHPQAAMGTPLFDKFRGREALDCLLDHLARTFPNRAGLMIPTMALEGPTAALIQTRSREASRPLHVFDLGARAILRRADGPVVPLERMVARQRLKKLDRNRRRLAEKAPIGFAIAQSPDALRDAAEDFLRLEAKGWKGRARTALLASIPSATFARTLIRTFAQNGQCRIVSLTLDEKPIAMAVVLTSGDRAFIWKVAYDEAFSSFSPGTQLILDLTRAHLVDDAIAVTDSCAVPDHPMIDHIWRDRMPIGDVLVALPERPAAVFARAVALETFARGLTHLAKKTVRRFRGGKQT